MEIAEIFAQGYLRIPGNLMEFPHVGVEVDPNLLAIPGHQEHVSNPPLNSANCLTERGSDV